ncbi:MAG: hypothetical protein U1E50_12875 [Caulobacteraceae bacterium]
MCLAADRIIHTLEAFEITEAHDTPRADLRLFGSHPSERSIPWPERARTLTRRRPEHRHRGDREPNKVMFMV